MLSIVPIKSRIGSFIVINGQVSIPQSCHSSIILLHLRCLQVRFPELLFLLLVGHLAHLLLDLMLLVSFDHLKILLLLLFSALVLHFLILGHVEEIELRNLLLPILLPLETGQLVLVERLHFLLYFGFGKKDLVFFELFHLELAAHLVL